MTILKTPINQKDILNFKAGDEVLLSGTIFTARDKAHQFFLDSDFKQIRDGIIYHCGPIVEDKKIVAAGPTTSARLNTFTSKLIDKYSIKAIIGKGGMSADVLRALKGRAIYLSAIGGAGVLYGEKIKLKNIFKKEFGMAEAVYEFDIKNFPLVVGIDAYGNSLYDEVYERSKIMFDELIK